ncbi:lipase 1-like isoform X2 [Cylas formicarius]|uniref:lipase 1-like isoform X2 n=1 Tax=Cylas formicarius TaxID=197179 RepID=UPI0029589315|nr:lipase 1-like isoform X2 [Cylas formicarius]
MYLVPLLWLSCVLAGAHPNENLAIVGFATQYGYSIEVHTIHTPDGYILQTHRIYQPRSDNKTKRVVLLAHGIAHRADYFVVSGKNALAFYLAERDFDVWLLNARGTKYSRRHEIFDPDKDARKFWDFSWHEIGVYDLAENLDYILSKTASNELYYVGHSQGCTALLVLLSERPEVNDKIKMAALTAPAAHLELSASPLWWLAADSRELLVGMIFVLAGCLPSGFSLRQLDHYLQITKAGQFRQYDFGPPKNLRKYNRSTPPPYNLSNVRAPIAILYAKNDPFAGLKSSKKLADGLPTIAQFYEVPREDFGHTDFAFAINAKELVNDVIYELFDKN